MKAVNSLIKQARAITIIGTQIGGQYKAKIYLNLRFIKDDFLTLVIESRLNHFLTT